MLSNWIKTNNGSQELRTRLVHVTVTRCDADKFHVSAYSPMELVRPVSMTIRTDDVDEAKKSILSYIQVKAKDRHMLAKSLDDMMSKELRKLEETK
ncbi:MAG: hypothetical protein HDQ88_08255 [Clostridia bacterium]|nr:hypothetical protein [Clostridia bacterium]